ncbi:ATP-binding protein [Streptomyces sp. VRA16 Mangrove soil]|uniref:ATP-binding protein n=1 Tax=Streptomyces sp. VRA16 Mangrove soil TaxID=2817434 RepID=UPI001A9FD5EE|nr:ATP-binding protein [Streptomyces sp. VRA16 Mangrove soil]MBO1332663.1 ATP-binding protein [Streptomyces sp. VRA16 Mangrove soil]
MPLQKPGRRSKHPQTKQNAQTSMAGRTLEMANSPPPGTVDLSCADARSRVRLVLEPLLRTLPASRATRLQQDACLIVSELVTNALLHAGGVRDFQVCLEGQVLTVRVGDHSSTPPTPRSAVASVPGGHGWMIIERLSDSVTAEPDARGKTVTATLDASCMAD